MASTILSVSTLMTDIFPLIAPVRPNWSPSTTYLREFTGGINNTVFGLFNSSDQSDALVIKIFGSKTEEFIDRAAELNFQMILSQYELAQPVLIQFENGVIYKFLPGEMCTREDMRDIKIAPLIACHMAKLHSVPIIDKDQTPCLVPLMRKFLTLIGSNQNQPEDYIAFISAVDWVERVVLPRLFPDPQYGRDLVLCHNDIVCKNILYHSPSQTVSFIDFEYCAVNFALFDVANHFVEYAGVDQIDFDRYPTRNEQCRWLQTYFQARNLPFTEPEKTCELIDRFSALSHLCFGLWSFAHIPFANADSDYEIYGRRRWNRFQELKSTLFLDF